MLIARSLCKKLRLYLEKILIIRATIGSLCLWKMRVMTDKTQFYMEVGYGFSQSNLRQMPIL